MERVPVADVAPAEVRFQRPHFALRAGLFQNRVVDRYARHPSVLAPERLLEPGRQSSQPAAAPGRRDLLDALEAARDLRGMAAERGENRRDAPAENSAVPDRAARDQAPGLFHVGLFGKAPDAIKRRSPRLALPLQDIAV